MITRFKSALNRIKAEDALVDKTEAYLRKALEENQNDKNNIFENRRSVYMKKKLAVAACLALLVIGGGTGAYAYYKTPVSYLSLDINPSVELGVNSFGKVVKTEAYNNDGSTILKGIDVSGSSVKDAVDKLVASAAKNGFIQKDGSSVVSLTSETDNDKTASELQDEAQAGAEDALEQEGDKAEIQKDNVALARRDEARKLGITPGKLNLIQKLQAVDPTATVDQYKDAKVKDIMKSIQAAKAKSKSTQKDDGSSAAAPTDPAAESITTNTTGTTTNGSGSSKSNNGNSNNGNSSKNKNSSVNNSGSTTTNTTTGGSGNSNSSSGNGNSSSNGNGNSSGSGNNGNGNSNGHGNGNGNSNAGGNGNGNGSGKSKP